MMSTSRVIRLCGLVFILQATPALGGAIAQASVVLFHWQGGQTSVAETHFGSAYVAAGIPGIPEPNGYAYGVATGFTVEAGVMAHNGRSGASASSWAGVTSNDRLIVHGADGIGTMSLLFRVEPRIRTQPDEIVGITFCGFADCYGWGLGVGGGVILPSEWDGMGIRPVLLTFERPFLFGSIFELTYGAIGRVLSTSVFEAASLRATLVEVRIASPACESCIFSIESESGLDYNSFLLIPEPGLGPVLAAVLGLSAWIRSRKRPAPHLAAPPAKAARTDLN